MTRSLTIDNPSKTLMLYAGDNPDTIDHIYDNVLDNKDINILDCSITRYSENANPSAKATSIVYVEEIEKADTIIFACPEWNGSYPWFFKKLIDELPYKTFKGKTMKMIVWSGGNNGANMLKASLVHLAHNLQMNVSSEYSYLD